jgi:hypothetical protein
LLTLSKERRQRIVHGAKKLTHLSILLFSNYAQKIKRLEKFGGSGTPYTDKASIKQAIQNFKNPVPVRLDMKEATGFPMPQVDIKPQITSLPIPQTTKQRVVVNTPEGDKIRVQDIKTKKFLGWEDAKGLPSDVENPSGNASQDFPEMRRIKTPAFATGGFTNDPPDWRTILNYKNAAPAPNTTQRGTPIAVPSAAMPAP